MEPINIKFEGPFSYEEFITNNPDNSSSPGVYIWGFRNPNFSSAIVDDLSIKLKEGLEMTTDQMLNQIPFFPYYVGKHQSNVFQRIKEHFRTIHSNHNTYTIFEKNVYSRLPEYLVKVTRQANPNKSALEEFTIYVNDKDFFKRKYNLEKDKGTNSTTVDISNANSIINDTINEIFTPENIIICFAPFPFKNKSSINQVILSKSEEKQLRNAEAAVKFCLRINTIGYSKNIDTSDNISISFNHVPSIYGSSLLGDYLFYGQKIGHPDFDPKNKRYFAFK